MVNKKLLFLGIFLLMISGVLAVSLTYFGQITSTVNVNRALTVTGGNCNEAGVCTETLPGIAGGESVTSEVYTINSQTSVNAPIQISTSVDPSEEGIATNIEYSLFAQGDPAGSESRIFIRGEDVGVFTLNDLNTISWDTNAILGYLPHIDVLIDTDGDGIKDDALVFEYAKATVANCDNSPYPTGNLTTFYDKGNISEATYAWLTTGDAGPCSGSPTFFWHSLADWKAGQTNQNGKNINGATPVKGFDLEVDSWIEESSARVSGILINGNAVDITIKPAGTLDFYTVTNFDVDSYGEYELTTTVTPQ
ncbi:MAG: hypothetical protein KKG75_01535 [Nanoarchaeota archaeon]|nr:hypothetical protein [Nanoarchaeota archaeon]